MSRLGKIYPIIAALQNFDNGMIIGWMMPATGYLSQSHPKYVIGGNSLDMVSGFSKIDISWVISSLPIICMIMSIIYGCLFPKINLRHQLLYLGFFKVLNWGFLLFGPVTPNIYIFGRSLTGVALPIHISLLLYIEEITQNHNRGFYLSLTGAILNVGVLFAFVLGACVDFQTNLIIIFLISIFLWLPTNLLPDSPIWLKKHGLDLETFEVLKKLRGENSGVIKEIQNIDIYLAKSVTLEGNCIRDIKLLLSKSYYFKSIILVVALFIMQSLSGIGMMIYFGIELINENSPIGRLSMIVSIGIGCFLGSLLASCFSDRIGRRPLLLISSGGVALALGMIAIDAFFKINIPWIPILCVLFDVFLINIGLGPLPFVLMSEILPNQLRVTGSFFGFFILSLLTFIICQTFLILTEMLNLSGYFALFSLLNMLSFAIILFFVPETNAIPRHLMEDMIYNKKEINKPNEQDNRLLESG